MGDLFDEYGSVVMGFVGALVVILCIISILNPDSGSLTNNIAHYFARLI